MPWLDTDTYHVPLPTGSTICWSLVSPSLATTSVPAASNTSTFASSPEGLVGTTEMTAPPPPVVNEKVSTSVIRSMIPAADRNPFVAVSAEAVAIVPPKSSARKPSPPAG